jgi:pSer/pThr/pTyr-binding forkhead associated (FHA) protein
MPLTLLLRSSESSTHGDGDRRAPDATLRDGVPALTFDGARVVIGRGPGCDVRLPDPSVSHRHATVRATGSEYALVDEKSTNGTFIAGTRLAPNTPRPLKHGDVLRVGRVWLEVRIDQTPATRDLALATRDLALALVSQAMRAVGQEAETKLLVVAGPDAGTALALAEEGRIYVIGRDASCDLPLADTDVSRTHVHVARRGGTVLLRDLGSKNGARLGDSRLPAERDVPWRSGTTVRIGGTTIALEEPAAIALAELEAAEDEPMAPEDAPPEPPPRIDGERIEPEAAKARGPEGAGAGEQDPSTFASSRPRVPSPPAKEAAWNSTDLGVVVAALVLLGLSVAGLFWLLHT